MSTSGWIGVDLDGTLAHYGGWDGGKIGRPIPLMVDRVKAWLSQGVEVRIFTARVAGQPLAGCFEDPEAVCPIDAQRRLIQDWCEEHIGKRLPVTHQKDYSMIELWDDRAVSVKANTGLVLGGTGTYSDGRIDETDEGDLRMAVGVREGVLCLDFGKAVSYLGFDPKTAKELALRLNAFAETGL